MTVIENEVKATVLALMNAGELTADSYYEIYGMKIFDSTIDYTVTISYNYLNELLGSTKLADANNKNKVVACCVDMAAVRIYGTLGGISIPTHFNYKDSDLTITKNVAPMIEQGIKVHTASMRQWFKILMSDSWAKVSPQTDLTYISPIYAPELGHDLISYDSPLNY